MKLIAYVDESDSGDNTGISLVAGFVPRETEWSECSSHWGCVCHEPPCIDYYHFNELKGREWAVLHRLQTDDPRKKTATLLSLLVQFFDFDPRIPVTRFRADSSVMQHDFSQIIKGRLENRAKKKATYQWLTNPDYFCFVHFVRNVLYQVQETNARLASDSAANLITCVDFVVDDQQKVSRQTKALFVAMKEVAPDPFRKLMGSCQACQQFLQSRASGRQIACNDLRSSWRHHRKRIGF